MSLECWSQSVSCFGFHPTLPLLVAGTTTPSNVIFEAHLDRGDGYPMVGAPLAMPDAITHVIYWNTSGEESEALGVSAKANRRVVIAITTGRTILVVDMIRRCVLYRHEPRSNRLMNKAGRVAMAKVYTPYLYFVVEEPQNSSEAQTASSQRAKSEEHVKMPTIPSVFIVNLTRTNTQDLGKLVCGQPIEQLAVHPLSPIVAVGHAMEGGMSYVRLYTHFGGRPLPYTVIGSDANAGHGRHILSVNFLPTNVSATAIEMTKKERKKKKGTVVLVANVMLAIAKARHVSVIDASCPGEPVELFYVAPQDRTMFVSAFAQLKDPSTLWVADTTGKAQPYAMHDLLSAATKSIAVLPVSDLGPIAFDTEQLPAVLRAANPTQGAPQPFDDGHRILVDVDGAAPYEGRCTLACHTFVEFAMHPNLPYSLCVSPDSFVVKHLSPRRLPNSLWAPAVLGSAVSVSNLHVDPMVFVKSPEVPTVLPNWYAVAECESLETSAIRVFLASTYGGSGTPVDESANYRSSWQTVSEANAPKVRPQATVTLTVLLEDAPVAINQVHMVPISSLHKTISGTNDAKGRVLLVAVVYSKASAKPSIGARQRPERRLAVFLVDEDSLPNGVDDGTLENEPPRMVVPCASAAVDSTSGTVYYTTPNDASTIQVIPMVDSPPEATDAWLSQLFADPIKMQWPASVDAEAAAAAFRPLQLLSAESPEPILITFNAHTGIAFHVSLHDGVIKSTLRLPPPADRHRRDLVAIAFKIHPTLGDALLLSDGTVAIREDGKTDALVMRLGGPASAIQWCGPVLLAWLLDGRCVAVARKRDGSWSTSGLLSVPAQSHFVTALPDRIIVAQTSTHLLKQEAQSALNGVLHRVRLLQSQAQKMASAKSSATPQKQQEAAMRQQQVMMATAELQQLTTNEDRRKADPPLGGAFTAHINVRWAAILLRHIDEAAEIKFVATHYDLTAIDAAAVHRLAILGYVAAAVELCTRLLNQNVASNAMIFHSQPRLRLGAAVDPAFPPDAFDAMSLRVLEHVLSVANRGNDDDPFQRQESSASAPDSSTTNSTLTAALDELGWFPARESAMVPTTAASRVLATLPASCVPAVIANALAAGDLDVTEAMRSMWAAGQPPELLSRLVQQYGSKSPGDVRAVLQAADGRLRSRRPESVFTESQPLEIPQQPVVMEGVRDANTSKPLSHLAPPMAKGYWLHSSLHRKQLPAAAIVGAQRNTPGTSASGGLSNVSQSDDGTSVSRGDIGGNSSDVGPGEAAISAEALSREQQDLRQAYLDSVVGVKDDIEWSDDDKDDGPSNMGGGIRLGGVMFKEKAAAATEQVEATATEAAAEVSASTRRLGALAAPAMSSTANRRRVRESHRELSVADHLRTAFSAFNKADYDGANQSLRLALPMLIADPEEIAAATKIQQLVQYAVCCRILADLNEKRAGCSVVERSQRLMHLLQLRLNNDHIVELCEKEVFPTLIDAGLGQSAESAMTLYKFAAPEAAGTSDMDALAAKIASCERGTPADEIVSDAGSRWRICYMSLDMLEEVELQAAVKCSYCSALVRREAALEEMQKQQRRSVNMATDDDTASAPTDDGALRCPLCRFGSITVQVVQH